jgi:hypothetical protein
MSAALSGLKHKAFSFAAGEDYALDIEIEPPASVAGDTFALACYGFDTTISFPPTTTLPGDAFFYPAVPVYAQTSLALAVTPGVLPRLPTSGSSDSIVLTEGAGLAVVDEDRGVFRATFAAALTAAVRPQLFTWYFRRTTAGSVALLKWGTFHLLPSPASAPAV